MSKFILSALLFCWSSLAAEKPTFPDLPESPAKLIETLESADTHYTIGTSRFDYVRDSDIPYLVGLLDSKASCAHVVLSISSQLPSTRSTVGQEAAYLIEGFWKRYYPTELSSQSYQPDVEGIKRWYRIWSNVKGLAEGNDTTKDVRRTQSPGKLTVIKHCLQPFGTFEIIGTEIRGIEKLEDLTSALRNHRKQHPKATYEFVAEIKSTPEGEKAIVEAIKGAGITLEHYWAAHSAWAPETPAGPHGVGYVDHIQKFKSR